MKTTMWHQLGADDNHLLVLLKCPGKDELIANSPAAGKTGENLCSLFRCIAKASDNRISLCKRDVEIVNSSKVPHYAGSPYGIEVDAKELYENVDFVRQCVRNEHIERILCCGKHAEALLRMICSEMQKVKNVSIPIVFYICHPGDQGLLDGCKRYEWPERVDNVETRLDYLASKIVEKWNNKSGWCLPPGSGYWRIKL